MKRFVATRDHHNMLGRTRSGSYLSHTGGAGKFCSSDAGARDPDLPSCRGFTGRIALG